MGNPIVTVWSSLQLSGATSLPQFHQVSGMKTRSIQIANDSDVAIVFHPERGLDLVVSARYQANAPLEANTEYTISLAAGQIGSQAPGQVVTVAESEQESSYSSQQITAQVAFVAANHVRNSATNAGAGTLALATWGANAPKPAVIRARVAIVVRGASPGAAEAMADLQISDGGGNIWHLCGGIANEGEQLLDDVVYPSPVTSAILNPGAQWTANLVTTVLVGAPAMDIDVELEWVT